MLSFETKGPGSSQFFSGKVTLKGHSTAAEKFPFVKGYNVSATVLHRLRILFFPASLALLSVK